MDLRSFANSITPIRGPVYFFLYGDQLIPNILSLLTCLR